jgi:predicted dehydrogenase
MAKIKAALVGYGSAGRILHAPLIRATVGLELAAVVSSRADDVHDDLPDVIVVPDLATALSNPDIGLVVIATPNALHAEQAHAALDAGKHVVIDKPFTTTLAEAESIAEHARRTGLTVCVFQNRRWDAHILTAKAMLDAGRFGTVSDVILRYDRLRDAVPGRWHDLNIPGSGVWFNLGSHLVDQAIHLFGRPLTISAEFARQRPGAVNDDYFNVVLGYDHLRVMLHACMISPAPGPVIEIQGSHGAFVKYGQDTQEEMLKARRTPGDNGWGVDPVPATFTAAEGETTFAPQPVVCGPGHYCGFYEGMAAAIRGEAPAPVALEDSLLAMRLLDLAVQSAHEDRRLKVEG